MADKFIIHGATFNGDGTTKDEAASNGGVGAWNNINIFEGTAPAFGSLAAGDTVYIRSKDASGADITRSFAASVTLGSSAATAGSPIQWIVDDGTIWSGVDGTVTYQWTANIGGASIQNWNMVKCARKEALVFIPNATHNTYIVRFLGQSILENALLNCAATGGGGSVQGSTPNPAIGTLLRCKIRTAGWFSSLFQAGNYITINVVDCDIEATAFDSDPVFRVNGAGGYINVTGGRLYGDGATSAINLVDTNIAGSKGCVLVGFNYPATIPIGTTNPITTTTASSFAFASDSLFGGESLSRTGHYTSRNDGNFPALNAKLPNSANTPWSYKLATSPVVNEFEPMTLHLPRIYAGTDAVVTATLEILKSQFVTGDSKATVWMEVRYTDATSGLRVTETTRVPAGGALDSSTANWLPSANYGAVSCTKHKLTLTTAGQVKQDTVVLVTLFTTISGNDPANKFWFVCPDVQLT